MMETLIIIGKNRPLEKGNSDYGAWLKEVKDACLQAEKKFLVLLTEEHNSLAGVYNQ